MKEHLHKKEYLLSFWSLEPPYVNGRLRYHLGQLSMLEQARNYLSNGCSVDAIICDAPSIVNSRSRSDVIEQQQVIQNFLKSVKDSRLNIYLLSERINEMKDLHGAEFNYLRKSFHDSFDFLSQVIAGCSISDQAIEDLIAYRQPVELIGIKNSLKSIVTQIKKITNLPEELIPSVLYAFKYRASWFEAGAISETLAFICSFNFQSGEVNPKIIESQRNAYSMQVLKALYLTAKIESKNIQFPELVFTENIKARRNNSYMKLNDADGCLFIDMPIEEITTCIRDVGTEILEQWCHVFFNTVNQDECSAERIIGVIRSYRGKALEAGLLKSIDHSDPEESKKITIILSGGGAKGVAHVGALSQLWPYYSFNAFLGTSAGAIVAGLLGAGYR